MPNQTGLYAEQYIFCSILQINNAKTSVSGIPYHPKFQYHSAMAEPPIAKTVELINVPRSGSDKYILNNAYFSNPDHLILSPLKI